MRDDDFLAERFEAHRVRLRAVAQRMLGSVAEADDAVQEAWVRVGRADTRQVENFGGWLTTIVGRVCLDMLRARRSRAEQPLEAGTPVPVADHPGPEQDALLADSVGTALLVVLDTLTPAERLAFVLHDLFAVPFDEIGGVIGKSPAATRQLASRARRRVRGAQATETDPTRRRELGDAFLAAARDGDFDGLLDVLDPDVVVRTEIGVTTGALAVAKGATTYSRHITGVAVPALVEGRTGIALLRDGRVERTLAFTFVHDRITVIDIVTDPERAARLEVTLL